MKRLAIVLAALGLIAASGAPSPTQAWRRVFNTGTYDDRSAGIDVDANGSAYLQYVDSQPGHNYIHLVKIGATSGIVFDKVTDWPSNYLPAGVYVTPIIGGQQYVY